MLYRPIRCAEDFARTVVLENTEESKHLEFKAAYAWQVDSHEIREEQQLEVCRDVAQFANTEGGVLLVGVSERNTSGRRSVAERIVPIPDADRLKQWVEQAIRNHLTPSTFSRDMVPCDLDGGRIVAINVEPSVHLVALWHNAERRGIEYLYRTDHGKQWMNPEEVEKHLMNSSRAMGLRLVEVFQKANRDAPVDLAPAIDVVPRLTIRGREPGDLPPPSDVCRVIWSALDDAELQLKIFGTTVGDGSLCIVLPHGLVREAWVTSDRRPGLCLHVRVHVHPDGRYALEPV